MRLALWLAAVAAVLAAAAVDRATAAAPRAGTWNDLFVLDCSGQVYVTPTQSLFAFGGDAAIVRKVWDFVVRAYQNRVRCRCPTIRDATLATYFGGTFRTVLQWLEPKFIPQLDDCQRSPATNFLATNLKPGDSFDFQLPATCSSARYAAGQPCLLSYPLGRQSGASVRVAVAQCPDNSNVPYVSVSCSGAACATLGRPCVSSDDCAGGPCTEVDTRVNPTDYSQILQYLRDGAVTAGLFDSADSCTTDDGDALSNATIGAFLFKSIASVLSPYFGGTPQPDSTKMCHVEWLRNGDTPWATCSHTTTTTGSGVGTSSVYAIDCNTTSWDGTLDDGTSVLDPNRMARYGTDPVSAAPTVHPLPVDPSGNGVRNLAVYTCDDRLGLLMSDPLLRSRWFTPPLHAVYTAVWGAVTKLAQCRSTENGAAPCSAAQGGPTGCLSPTQIESRWNMMSALPYLVNFTQHNDVSFTIGQAMTDLFSYQYWLWFDGGPSYALVNLPDGCTLADWLARGECRAEFTGFRELLGQDVTVRMRLQRCPDPASAALFNATLDCVGSKCDAVLQPYVWQYCTQDSDCPAGVACTTIPMLAPFVAAQLWLRWENCVQPTVTLTPPPGNPALFSSMSFAQQNAMAQQLAVDLARVVNDNMAASHCVHGPPCVNQTASLFVLSGLALNPQNRPQLLVSYVMMPGRGMSTSSVMPYLSGGLSNGFGRPYPWAQYATSAYPAGNVYYVQCPDGSWQTDVTYCTPQDTCDPKGQLQIDAINLLLSLRGLPQRTDLTPPGVHGFCALPVQNVSTFEQWSDRIWSSTPLPAPAGQPPVQLFTIEGLAPFEAPDPNDPNCFTQCGAAPGGAAPSLAAVAVAALLAVAATATRHAL